MPSKNRATRLRFKFLAWPRFSIGVPYMDSSGEWYCLHYKCNENTRRGHRETYLKTGLQYHTSSENWTKENDNGLMVGLRQVRLSEIPRFVVARLLNRIGISLQPRQLLDRHPLLAGDDYGEEVTDYVI